MLNCPHCEHELTPHEIGILNAAVGRIRNSTSRRFWRAKLTNEDVDLICKSDEPIKELAKNHKVSFVTIWRVKNYITHKGQTELNCPHCKQELTPKEIGRLFATLGGSTTSPRKTRAATANARKRSKLTDDDIADIRESNASTRELARKHKVLLSTIRDIRKKKKWKPVSSE